MVISYQFYLFSENLTKQDTTQQHSTKSAQPLLHQRRRAQHQGMETPPETIDDRKPCITIS